MSTHTSRFTSVCPRLGTFITLREPEQYLGEQQFETTSHNIYSGLAPPTGLIDQVYIS